MASYRMCKRRYDRITSKYNISIKDQKLSQHKHPRRAFIIDSWWTTPSFSSCCASSAANRCGRRTIAPKPTRRSERRAPPTPSNFSNRRSALSTRKPAVASRAARVAMRVNAAPIVNATRRRPSRATTTRRRNKTENRKIVAVGGRVCCAFSCFVRFKREDCRWWALASSRWHRPADASSRRRPTTTARHRHDRSSARCERQS
jgi:hypothetical protein